MERQRRQDVSALSSPMAYIQQEHKAKKEEIKRKGRRIYYD